MREKHRPMTAAPHGGWVGIGGVLPHGSRQGVMVLLLWFLAQSYVIDFIFANQIASFISVSFNFSPPLRSEPRKFSIQPTENQYTAPFFIYLRAK